MHALLPPDLLPSARKSRRNQAGFSLAEVAMAIGIIAVVFVALVALLPIGLNTYRASIDESNNTWIIQSINSMVQTTDYASARKMSFEEKPIVYYYDEEGRLVDRHGDSTIPESTEQSVIFSRAYAVKLFVDDIARPGSENQPGRQSTDEVHALRVIVVMAPYNNGIGMKQFDDVTTIAKLTGLPALTPVRVKVLTLPRMDAEPKA